MTTKSKVFLASSSPRRLELLKNLGCRVAQIIVPFDEPKVLNFKDPLAFMRLCLKQKYQQTLHHIQGQKEIHNGSQNNPNLYIVADTIVVKGAYILGKPAEKIEAFKMLKKLSGSTHEVYTGVCLWITCAQVPNLIYFKNKITRTKVRFRDLSDHDIREYIRSGEPMDKAGAYGLQGQGLQLIEAIEGSYSAVVGLPLNEVLAMIQQAERVLHQRGLHEQYV